MAPAGRHSVRRNGRHSAKARLLPELELEVMKRLWALGAGTVADVQGELKPFRPLAYTTIMTVLERLERKGVVTRKKKGRSYVYSPVLTRESARDAALGRLLADFFSNSPDKLADFLGRRDRSRRAFSNGATGAGPARSIDSVLL